MPTNLIISPSGRYGPVRSASQADDERADETTEAVETIKEASVDSRHEQSGQGELHQRLLPVDSSTSIVEEGT
jgi:hypothetical protein